MKCPDMSNGRECIGSLCSLYMQNRPCLKPHKITFIENDNNECWTIIIEEVSDEE